MQNVHYAGAEFVTTDELAEELIQYAVDLGQRSKVASVDVPGLDSDGNAQIYHLVMGPASELVTSPTEMTGDVDDVETLADLHTRREAFNNEWKVGTELKSFYDDL